MKKPKCKKTFGALVLTCVLFLNGCSTATPEESSTVDGSGTNISFVSGMGCSDPTCTDPSHHHDCPSDCTEYDHHHHCDLDCTDPAHNHHSSGHTGSSHH